MNTKAEPIVPIKWVDDTLQLLDQRLLPQQERCTQGSAEVPLHLRNAPTKLMGELGYGKQYRHAHDEPDAYAAGENYFPESMSPRRYYEPVKRGLEIQISDKLARLHELDKQAKK